MDAADANGDTPLMYRYIQTVFSQRFYPNVTAQLSPEQRRVCSGPASARRQPQHQKLVRANGN